MHVADLVSALIAAAERGTRLPGEPGHGTAAIPTAPADRVAPVDPRGYYFIAGDQDLTYGDLGRLSAQALGLRRMLVVPVPGPLVWSIAAGAELVARSRGRAPFTGLDKAREALAGDWTCSAARARNELDFAPAASLAERLEQTVAGYRRQGLLR